MRSARQLGWVWVGGGAAALVAVHWPENRRATTPTVAPLHGMIVAANMNDNTASIKEAVMDSGPMPTAPTGNGPHEVAVSHNGRLAVVSNYGVRGAPGNSLTVINLAVSAARLVAFARSILGNYHNPHGSAFLPGEYLAARYVARHAGGHYLST